MPIKLSDAQPLDEHEKQFPIRRLSKLGECLAKAYKVKSGNVGHQVNSDSDLVCFIF